MCIYWPDQQKYRTAGDEALNTVVNHKEFTLLDSHTICTPPIDWFEQGLVAMTAELNNDKASLAKLMEDLSITLEV